MADRVTVWDGPTILRKFKRSYKIAAPDADAEHGQPLVDASVARDLLLPVMANAVRVGDTSSLYNRTAADLDRIGKAEGVTRPAAVGASGYVTVTTATGGATIYAGDEVRPKGSKVRYQVSVTGLYDGNTPGADQVLIVGVDVGPGTNLPAGTEMEWSNPRSGCSPSCVVWDEGLVGGRDQADNDEYAAVIIERRGHPAIADNDGSYIAVMENPFNTGLAIQKGFWWGALMGTGTGGASFTMRPQNPGGSRIPTEAQLTLMDATLAGMPFSGDDGVVMITLAEQAATVQFRATWKKAAAGWASSIVWPEYIVSTPVVVDGAVAIAAEGFRVTTAGITDAPIVGQVIGLFNTEAVDSVTGEIRPGFERKTIETVTEIVAGQSWDLTFDMTAGGSSLYVPADGALVSPWSDSLNLVTPPVVAYFDSMGPGEMLDPLPDPGRRGRRQPESPESWPSIINNRLDALVQAVSAVRSATLVSPSATEATTTGTPGVLAYLRRLTDMAVYAED